MVFWSSPTVAITVLITAVIIFVATPSAHPRDYRIVSGMHDACVKKGLAKSSRNKRQGHRIFSDHGPRTTIFQPTVFGTCQEEKGRITEKIRYAFGKSGSRPSELQSVTRRLTPYWFSVLEVNVNRIFHQINRSSFEFSPYFSSLAQINNASISHPYISRNCKSITKL